MDCSQTMKEYNVKPRAEHFIFNFSRQLNLVKKFQFQLLTLQHLFWPFILFYCRLVYSSVCFLYLIFQLLFRFFGFFFSFVCLLQLWLFVYLSISLFIFIFMNGLSFLSLFLQFMSVSLCVRICLSVCLSLCPFIIRSIIQSFFLSFFLSVLSPVWHW